jgi:hypothetical protein
MMEFHLLSHLCVKEVISYRGLADIERGHRLERYTVNRRSGSLGPENAPVAEDHLRRQTQRALGFVNVDGAVNESSKQREVS